MMEVTDAQGRFAVVDARVKDERPRPEVQPVVRADSVRFMRLNMAKPSHPPGKAGSRGEALIRLRDRSGGHSGA